MISLAGGFGCATGTGGGDGTGGGGGTGGTTTQTGGSNGSGGAPGSGGSTTGSGGTTGTGGATPGTGGGSTGGTTGTGGGTAGTGGGTPGTGGGAAGTGGGSPGTGGGSPGTGGSSAGGAGGAAHPTGGAAGAVSSGGSGGGLGGLGGAAGGHAGGAGGAVSTGGAGGAATVSCSSASGVITYPTLPGATKSPLYTVTANGTSQFVEKLTKFSPEMQVHYANFGVATGCTTTVAVTLSSSFTSYTLSPQSQNIAVTKSGNTLTFTSGPNYLILQVASQELLFILIDNQETNPPKLGDANVKNLADYTVDNTGGTVVTSKIQSAINAASGATQNILYVPPGKYKTGELSLKSNMTLYLAAGSILDGSTSTSDYAVTGTPAVESTQHAVVHLYNVTNTNILGRGVIDGEGTAINKGSNDTPAFKINVLRIDSSSKVTIDGILVRDPVFWNTLAYMSSQVTLQNYKVINRRPTTTTYNQTDGIDIDASNNCTAFNTFVYSGDDSLSPKTEQEANMNSSNITYQKSVIYSNSGGCKIGTKTFGTTSNPAMTGIVFNDIDVVKAGRALVIDANDTALISGTTFENVRIEAADSQLIDIEEDQAPTWRVAPNTSIAKDTYFTNVSAGVKQSIQLHGLNSTVNVNGVHFSAFTVQGKAVTSQTDTDASWDINQYVSNITFQ
ncbi:MAG TPA: glycosyl hydrolase family 28 protein [Polyangia bacterium]|nr:glycosyl hydrolase family 28 protein [Polyangia bacterium]